MFKFKKEKKKEKFELLQVFDISDLNLSNDLNDELCDMFRADGDSYHRWYPKDKADKFYNGPTQEQIDEVNKALLKNGMKIDKDNKYFHVLIHVSW